MHPSLRCRRGWAGGRQSTFELARYTSPPDSAPANQSGDALTPLGHLSKETVYERAKYFLERVIPTAEEYNVQMACHLEDPPAPVLRGIEMWNYPVLEGCERFANLVVRNPLTSLDALRLGLTFVLI